MTESWYGKKRLSRELCNGQKDSAQVYTDCLYEATSQVAVLKKIPPEIQRVKNRIIDFVIP